MVPVELHALEVRLNSACSTSQSDYHPNCSRFLNTLLIVDSTSLSWSSSPICASISSLTSSGLSSVPTWCLLFLVKLDINFIQRWRPIFQVEWAIQNFSQEAHILMHWISLRKILPTFLGKSGGVIHSICNACITGTWIEVMSYTPAICFGRTLIGWKHRCKCLQFLSHSTL